MVVTETTILIGLLVMSATALTVAGAAPRRDALVIALLTIAFGMFAFTWIHSFFADEPSLWFQRPPPPTVSRVTLIATGLAVGLALVRSGREVRGALGDLRGPTAVALLIAVAGVAWTTAVPGEHFVTRPMQRIVFCVLASAMFALAFVVAAVIRSHSHMREHHWSTVPLLLLTGSVVALGYAEVVADRSHFKNMFVPGVIETRGASTFQNPNWFAFGLAPAMFVGIALSAGGHARTGAALAAVATIGLVASGSRSVLVVSVGAVLVLCLLASTGSSEARRRAMASVGIMGIGSALGIVVGFLGAILMGVTAIDRWTTLVERLVSWPLALLRPVVEAMTMPAMSGKDAISTSLPVVTTSPPSGSSIGTDVALHISIDGRLMLFSDTVDNAYIFLWLTNPPALALIVAVVVWIGARLVADWRRSRDFEAALRLSVFAFVVLAGMVGQVYWAFPVWIVMSVLLGWAIAGVPMARRIP
jgi:hypothetical protein